MNCVTFAAMNLLYGVQQPSPSFADTGFLHPCQFNSCAQLLFRVENWRGKPSGFKAGTGPRVSSGWSMLQLSSLIQGDKRWYSSNAFCLSTECIPISPASQLVSWPTSFCSGTHHCLLQFLAMSSQNKVLTQSIEEQHSQNPHDATVYKQTHLESLANLLCRSLQRSSIGMQQTANKLETQLKS